MYPKTGSHIIGIFVPPDAAGVVFGTCNDGVALVVERTRKDLIRMALQLLKKLPSLAVP